MEYAIRKSLPPHCFKFFLYDITTVAPILYVEDEIGFVDHLAFLLKRTGSKHRVIHVPHGEEAIAYLERKGKYADEVAYPMPGLILSDLKMPRVNGFELLEWIRKKSNVPWMPVVVLTISEEIKDVQKAYRLGANSFLIKPITPDDWGEMTQAWENYWLRQNARFMTA